MNEKKITLPITGMTCANCAANIERSVKKLDGVAEVNVNFASEKAAVAFDPQKLGVEDLVKKIEKTGYGIGTAKIEFPVTGMTCANCAMNIERTLNKKVPGVLAAAVNFASERVSVTYIPGVAGIEDMIAAVEKAGYGAIAPVEGMDAEDAEQQARDAEIRDQTHKFIVGVVFALPLFVLSMARDFGLIGAWSHAGWMNWLFFRPGHTGAVLHRMGLLQGRPEKPGQQECQHGRSGRDGVLGGLFLFTGGSVDSRIWNACLF